MICSRVPSHAPHATRARAARNKGALRAALIAENVNDGSDFESTLAAKGFGPGGGISIGPIAPVLVIKSCYQGGAACTASDVEEATCNEDACPIDGGWSDQNWASNVSTFSQTVSTYLSNLFDRSLLP
jgi:hypothetical protein